MQESQNLHWAEDENLLTDFIRQKLSEESLQSCEHHLASCQHCRQLVESEQIMASGIRSHARKELKQRIHARVAERRSKSLPIPRILVAAAMIGVIALVGIVNNWFTRQPTSKDLEEISLAPTEETEETGDIASSEPAKTIPREKEEPVNQEMKMSETSSATLLRKESPEGPLEIQVPKGSTPVDAMVASPPTVSEFAADEALHSRDSFAAIVQGSVRHRTSQAIELEEAKPRTMVAPRTAKKTARQDLAGNHEHLPVTLLQAPPTQETFLQGEQLISAQLIPSETGLQVVLYVDRSISNEEFDLAEISWVKDDSLNITLPSLQIGFRIPSEILNRQQALTPIHTGR